jgi:TPR repeat protein
VKALSHLLKVFSKKARHPLEGADAWSLFLAGRNLDAKGLGRRDPTAAFAYHLRAAEAGLPVAAVFVWHSYKVGSGAPPDPVAAMAWGQRATELGWPDGLLVAWKGESGHGHETEVAP